MNNLVIAAQLSSIEDSIKTLTEHVAILKQSISELNTNESTNESTSERSRDDLVKDILKRFEQFETIHE